MKTIKHISILSSITISLFAAVLFLAGCKKENLLPQTKSGNVISYDNEKQGSGTSVSQASLTSDLAIMKQVNMIKIDHIAARTHAPDYCITVKFDGTIVFEGRRNVSYIGTKEWRLDKNKFYAVKQLFVQSGFNSIEDNLSLLADVPMTYTTWCAAPASISKTLFDYNGDYPEGLISLRQKAEYLLDLTMLIYSDTKASGTVKEDSL